MTQATVAPPVAAGIEDLEQAFPGRVSHGPTGDGGADITVSDIELGPTWTRTSASVTFNLAYNYPFTAVYPFYLPAGVKPRNHTPPALQDVNWKGRPVVQVSLRHTRWNPTLDSAVGCVLQVQAWAQQQ